MRILSQYGYGDGNKTHEGLAADYIGGVVFRPRDIAPDKLLVRAGELHGEFPAAMLLFDPQVYAGILWTNENAHFGKLDEYRDYFGRIMLSRLELVEPVRDVIRNVVSYQRGIPVNAVITPNIIIRRSLDSREAVISKNFIRNAKSVCREFDESREVFATLSISRDALVDFTELQEFLNDITGIEDPPDGYYILIGANSIEARSDIFNSQVIAGWMLINYSLKVNDFKIINGYSDLLSPLLCAVGADFGCTGWWSNSRNFSLEQFTARQGGGSLPIQRYLSKALLNRIRFTELRQWMPLLEEIANDLETDDIFLNGQEEPERSREVLQSWEALSSLVEEVNGRSVARNLDRMEEKIRTASEYYSHLEEAGITPEVKSNRDHLEPMNEAIGLFRQIAEI